MQDQLPFDFRLRIQSFLQGTYGKFACDMPVCYAGDDTSSIDGFQLFMKTIFCNYYSWLSLGMILLTILLSVDFGKMREFEQKAINGELTIPGDIESGTDRCGKVIDLILPVIALIVLSIVSMLYTGGFFEGRISIGDAFANCDAILGLAMGAAYTVFFCSSAISATQDCYAKGVFGWFGTRVY